MFQQLLCPERGKKCNLKMLDANAFPVLEDAEHHFTKGSVENVNYWRLITNCWVVKMVSITDGGIVQKEGQHNAIRTGEDWGGATLMTPFFSWLPSLYKVYCDVVRVWILWYKIHMYKCQMMSKPVYIFHNNNAGTLHSCGSVLWFQFVCRGDFHLCCR